MPGGDRTGPVGIGPMTGRRMGYSVGNEVPGYAIPNPGVGMGLGNRWFGRRGFAGGFGWRYRYFASGQSGWYRARFPELTKDQELADLRAESEIMQERIKEIHQRIEELEKA